MALNLYNNFCNFQISITHLVKIYHVHKYFINFCSFNICFCFCEILDLIIEIYFEYIPILYVKIVKNIYREKYIKTN